MTDVRTALCVLSVWAPVVCADTVETVGDGKQPRIRVDREIDWGECLQGEVVRHQLKVYNDGTAPLEIAAKRFS